MKNFLDINWLRANHQMIHFFGLGFIQIKIDEKSRLHFYHPELPPFVEHPHNHRYDFTSSVLKGRLHNIIWKETKDENDDLRIMRFESCTATNTLSLSEARKTRGKIVAEFFTSKGSSYFMPKEVFHQARAVEFPTITLLSRGPKEYDFASILEPADCQSICPFSKNLPENELWDLVEDSIDND